MIPAYEEHPIPEELSAYFSRIMHLDFEGQEPVTIPARPTGHLYIGWCFGGLATASANGKEFCIQSGQGHISGQLTVFDAEYTLHNKLTHYLAEFTPLGAYQLIGKDLSLLTNVCDIFEPHPKSQNDLEAFKKYLVQLSKNVNTIDSTVAQAVEQINNTNGDISISSLADELDVSSRNLRRAFIKHIGIAPKPYALIRKVVFALQVLANKPDADILDVVHDAGFYDQSHLIKVFQLYLRASPNKLELDEDGVLTSIVAKS